MLQQLETQMREAAKKFEFEKAAQLRDQGDQLNKQKEAKLHLWKKQAEEVVGIVDEQVVAEVVKEMAGPEPDPLDDIPF